MTHHYEQRVLDARAVTMPGLPTPLVTLWAQVGGTAEQLLETITHLARTRRAWLRALTRFQELCLGLLRANARCPELGVRP